MHPGFEPGTPGSLRPSVGPYGKALFSVWDTGRFLSGALFFSYLMPLVPRLPSLDSYHPLRCLLLALGYPSYPKTHPGFEPGRTQSPGPTIVTDGKALSSMGDKERFSATLYFFLFHRKPTSPPSKLTFPSGAFFPLSGTMSRSERLPALESGTPVFPRPSTGAGGKELLSVGDPE